MDDERPEKNDRVLSDAEQREATRAMLVALELTELSRDDVLVGYAALGGNHLHHVDAYLRGEKPITAYEYNVLAQVFNDAFIDEGQDHPVPYSGQLGTDDSQADPS